MAGISDVVKRVLRFKLQLSDTPQSATVLKILQKLNNLDITVDVLAETGIGRTVNSFRKHKEAGELAKSLVKGWKKLIPKKSTSHTEDISDSLFIKERIICDRNSPEHEDHKVDDLKNNCLTPARKSLEDLTEKCPPGEIHKNAKRKKDKSKTSKRDDPKSLGNRIMSLKNAVLKDKCDRSVSKCRKNGHCKSRSGCQVQPRDKSGLHCEVSSLERQKEKSKKKSKLSKELPQDLKETFSSRDKHSEKSPNLNNAQQDRSSGSSSSSDNRNRKRNKREEEKSEHDVLSKLLHKKVKTQQENSESELEEPSMSFESYLSYDQKAMKKKNRSNGKKSSKRINAVIKNQPLVKPTKSRMPVSPKKIFLESPKDPLHIPLPDLLAECDKGFSFEYFEKKVEKEPDFGDLTEDSTFFTGHRLNKKMQVYSGAKTVFLPAMMSLYHQCVRTLQNNINLLYETGGVPFEILEPVLERCTPEQLLRIEDCNPLYIGVTDHLWGKHCQRDFKDAKLQQYESWKEMYIRVSEERERKFQTLAKKIILDHSKKPKGRQVKMAFIHTVAKPPRDVRIQQEIYGTAVQQPQQPRNSVKSQESKSRLSNEPAKNGSTTSGPSSTQEPRKKTRVAPMMAKSLKAFKKQLGRR
ncbi:elongin A, like [Hippocampus zosterae]|uniref:elongin A, like n=1 Tax=Hippocampus zosterae TaxID=109293 RepID=UPI00223DFA3F|nr:elongin A, like [Hippocampus zosterae]